MTISSIKGTSILLIFLVIPILNACKAKQHTSEGQNTEQATSETIVISFERTACFGQCPTFLANFYSDGKVQYHGIDNVENKGHFKGNITSSELEGIYQVALDIGFFSMKDKYDAQITDVPSQIYFIGMHGDKKKVFSRYNAPPELKKLGEHIDKVLTGIDWLAEEDHDR